MSPPRSGIVIERVTHYYEAGGQRSETLADISFQVVAGEILAVLGHSGCGKSTLLALIAGLVAPRSGDIWHGGRRVTGPGPDRVVVPQDYAVFPWMTAIDNVRFALKAQGADAAEQTRRAQECLLRLGLGTETFHKFPGQLSGGMRQRLALARAVATNPDCLLLDEPFSALDVGLKRELQRLFSGVQRPAGQTILWVTHDAEEAAFVADRVLLVDDMPRGLLREVSVPFSRPRTEDLRYAVEFRAFVQGELLAGEQPPRRRRHQSDYNHVLHP